MPLAVRYPSLAAVARLAVSLAFASASASVFASFQVAPPPTYILASDYVYTDHVEVSVNSGSLAPCVAATIVISRDGIDIGTAIGRVMVAGGFATYNDYAAPYGVHTYGARMKCTMGGLFSSAIYDVGSIQYVPAVPTAFSASVAAFVDRVRLSVTVPPAPACTSLAVLVQRDDGSVFSATLDIPVVGGSASVDDMNPGPGTHAYSASSTCTPGSGVSSAVSANGSVMPTAPAPTSVAATDYTLADRVSVTVAVPASPDCTSRSIVVSRDGLDIGTVSSVSISGGIATYDDIGVAVGVHTYAARSVCTPGGASSTSLSDVGSRLGTPATPLSIAASDYLQPDDRVTITGTVGTDVGQCSSRNVIIARDGVDIATLTTISLGGGSFSYDDILAPFGPRTYSARSICSTGGAASATISDTGGRRGAAAVPTSIIASDYQFADRVRVNFTASDDSVQCQSRDLVVKRDGVDLQTLSTVPLAGGVGQYDDMNPPFGVHSYSAYSVCWPGGATNTGIPDNGSRMGVASVPTAITATDFTLADRVIVSITGADDSVQCTTRSVIVARDGTDLTTITTIPVAGGTSTFQDMTVGFGVHSYTARAVCGPGGAVSVSASDTGGRLGVAATPTSISATDFTLADRVTVTITAADDSAQCTTRSVILARDGTDLTTITSIPVAGGTSTYDDMAAAVGLHTYAARSVCTPGGNVSATISDTGAKVGTPAVPTSVAATDYTLVDRVTVTVVAPNDSVQCSARNVIVARDGGDIATITAIPVGGGTSTYDDIGGPFGAHTYTARSICTSGGSSSATVSDTGGRKGVAAVPTSIVASDFAFNDRVRLTITAANDSAQCTTRSVIVARDGSDITTITTIPVAGGTSSYDDTTVSVGMHFYTARSVCAPGGVVSATVSDPGSRNGTPALPTIAATDFTVADRVTITLVAGNDSLQCTRRDVILARDGTVIASIVSIPLSGGTTTYDDIGVSFGTHSYTTHSLCTWAGTSSATATDTGGRKGVAATPTSISATDFTLSDRITVSVAAADDSAQCTTRSVVLARDGTDLTTITSIPVAGGTSTYDDMAAALGVHTYAARSVCSPGGAVSATISDTGAKLATPAVPTSIAATHYTLADRVTVTVVAANDSVQCLTRNVIVARDGADIATITTIPVAGGTSSYDDVGGPFGTRTYTARSICAAGGPASATVTDAGGRLGSPSTPVSVNATDFTLSDRVTVVIAAADDSAQCTTRSVIVSRDGTDLTTITTIPVAGGTSNFDDMAATAGTHTYAARAVCSPGGAVSATISDTGSKLSTPTVPSSVSATDFTLADRVTITVVAANDASYCLARNVILARDGSDIATITTIPVAGGTSSYDDVGGAFGVHSYSARSICTTGGSASVTVTDTGGRKGIASTPTAISATDFTLGDRVTVTITAADDSAQCTTRGVIIARDGTDLTTITTIPVAGGTSTYDDMAATGGIHTYAARSVCSPGGAVSATISDTGAKLATPAVPTSISATDYTVTDRVNVAVAAANDSAQCSARNIIVARDGVDIGTITTISVAGGSATYADIGGPFGTHTYSARSICTAGGSASATVTDTGGRRGAASTPTSLSATDFTLADRVALSVSSGDDSAQCTTRSVILARDGSDIVTLTSVPVAGGTSSYDDMSAPVGIHTYTARSICNPGVVASPTISDTGARLGTPSVPSSIAATDFTLSDRVTITVVAANDSTQCAARNVILARDGSDIATITTLPVAGGTSSYSDIGGPFGVHTYSARSICASGGSASATATDTGGRKGVAATPTAISATDFTLADRVTVSVSAADDSVQCTTRTVIISRDGADLTTITTIPVAGGAATYDDMTADFAVHSYAARSICSPGGAVSANVSDNGARQAAAPSPTAIFASDYTLLDRVSVSVTVPASPDCASRDIVVARDGSDIATLTGVPLTGGVGIYDDMGVTFGIHTYAARSMCNPSALASSSISDTGARKATAPAPTSIAATDYTLPDRVAITIAVPAAPNCSSRDVVLSRDSSDIATISTVPIGGANTSFDDLAPSPGAHIYAARSVCNPGGSVSAAITDVGGIYSSAAAPTGIAATDYTLSDRVRVSVTVGASPVCESRDIIISRDGSDISTVTGVPLLGGITTYDDLNPAPGPHTYGARSVCNPTGSQSATVTDAGAMQSVSPPPSSVVASDGLYSDHVNISVVVPGSPYCLTRDVVISRDGTDISTTSAFVLAGGTLSYDDVAVAAGVHNYSARTLCNPLAVPSSSVSDEGSIKLTIDPISALTASNGLVVGRVDITWTASYNATEYQVFRGSSADDPTPVLLQVITGTSYSDTTAAAGVQYWYSVLPKTTLRNGTVSPAVLGFADTPPSSAQASFETLQSQPSAITPSWIDADPGDQFLLSVVTQPAHGVATVSGIHLIYSPTTNYLGPDQFTFSVTDRAGASVSGSATGVVVPGIPDAPVSFAATQGTILGAVNLVWEVTPGGKQYLVLRSDSAADPNPATVATVGTGMFSDTGATPGVKYYYRIKAVGALGVSAASKQVSGYADTAPSYADASASTVFGISVSFAPHVVDPDPGEVFSLTVLSQPGHGTASVTNDGTGFAYAPSAGFSGVDTFTFTATDVAQASIGGTATISVGCPVPTVSALSVSQPKIWGGSGFTVNTSYGNTGCPVAINSTFEVRSGTTVVATSSKTGLGGVVSAPLSYSVDSLEPGTYLLVVSVTDAVTGSVASSSMPLVIGSYRMPTFTATGTLFAGVDQATVAVGNSVDCPLTENRAAAIADHALCYFEVTAIPPGLSRVTGQTLPTWAGRIVNEGIYSPSLSVYQYDDFGVLKLLGSAQRNMVVQPLSLMTFSSTPSLTTGQYMQPVTVTVTQKSGPACQVTIDRATAIAASARGVRMCLLEYSPIPAYGTATPAGLNAVFLDAGQSTVGWHVTSFDAAGNEYPIGSGSTQITVHPLDINLDLASGSTPPIATITKAVVRLNSIGSDRCALTLDRTKAQVAGVDKPCLLEWTAIPPGMAQDASTNDPLLTGVPLAAGDQAVGFKVSYFDVSGKMRELLSAVKSLSIASPPMPRVVIKGGREISPGLFAVPVSGGLVGSIVLDSTKWPIDAEIHWSDQAFAQTYRIDPARGTQIVPATPDALWNQRQFTVKLFLRGAADLFVTKTFDVLSVPADSVKIDLGNIPSSVPDSKPLAVKASVNAISRAGPVYDAATMGQWMVQFGLRDSSGVVAPMGDPVKTDANGVANGFVSPFGYTVIRVVAQATPVQPVLQYKRTMDSPPKIATVVKGTPIDAIAVLKVKESGPEPLLSIVRVQFATIADHLANESVGWKMSTDGGATWELLDITGLQMTKRLQHGLYQFKAVLVNRNTQEASETAPVSVLVWAMTKVVLTGSTYALPGTPVAINAKLTAPDGSVITDGVVEWSVSRRAVASTTNPAPPPIATGLGSAIGFTATDPGQYLVSVRARTASANPSDTRSWTLAATQVMIGTPEKPFVSVTGPVRAEVGKTYPFNLVIRTRFDITTSSLKLAGRWTLPDGRTVDSLTAAQYAPTVADFAAGKFVTLIYDAWIVGYQDATKVTTRLSVPIWQYVWPSWNITTSVVSQVAPTNASMSVMPSDLSLLPTLDGLTFQWTVPPTMRVLSPPGEKLFVTVDHAGSSVVGVLVTDARGNSTKLSSTISVATSVPYVITLPVTNMSKWAHAPLNVGLFPKVTGGHPMDSIVKWDYFLDGVRLDVPNKNVAVATIDQPGSHIAEIRITSKMGATASQQAFVSVPANVAPTCTITATPSANRLLAIIAAACRDPDGSIAKYQWSVNGTVQTFATSNKFNYVLPPGTSFPIDIQLLVTDDGGLTGSASATVQ